MKKEKHEIKTIRQTLIIGCGALGSAIANEKSKESKNVIVIDVDPKSFQRLDKNFSGETMVSHSNDTILLEEKGLLNANEIVVVTGNDNMNIFLGLYFDHYCSDDTTIFVRLEDDSLSVLLKDTRIKTISPSALSFSKYKQFKVKGDK